MMLSLLQFPIKQLKKLSINHLKSLGNKKLIIIDLKSIYPKKICSMAIINNKKFAWQGKHGPLLIAEIGGNHEGNFNYAKKLTKLAIKSDVDVIKFQIYTGDTLVNELQSPSRNKHFKKISIEQKNIIFILQKCVRIMV